MHLEPSSTSTHLTPCCLYLHLSTDTLSFSSPLADKYTHLSHFSVTPSSNHQPPLSGAPSCLESACFSLGNREALPCALVTLYSVPIFPCFSSFSPLLSLAPLGLPCQKQGFFLLLPLPSISFLVILELFLVPHLMFLWGLHSQLVTGSSRVMLSKISLRIFPHEDSEIRLCQAY